MGVSEHTVRDNASDTMWYPLLDDICITLNQTVLIPNNDDFFCGCTIF